MARRLGIGLLGLGLLALTALTAPATPAKEPVAWSGVVYCENTSFQCNNPQDLGYPLRKGEGFKIRYRAGAEHCATAHLQLLIGGKKTGQELVVPVGGDSGTVKLRAPRTGRLSVDMYSDDGCAADAGKIHSWGGSITVSPAKVSRRFKLSGRAIARKCDHARCQEKPLPGVSVSATAPGEDPGQVSTGADGRWSIEVPTGTWKVTPVLQDRSFEPTARTVVVKDRPVSKLDFETCEFVSILGMPKIGVHAAASGSPCDPDGIDWSMPDRLSEKIAKQEFTHDGLPNRKFLDPKAWEVQLFLTKERQRLRSACSRNDVRWRWVLEPKDDVKEQPRPGCSSRAKVKRLGMYEATAYKERRSGERWEKELEVGPIEVRPDDIVLAGIGDSSASGEGNPPFYFLDCNRSVTAYQVKAALFVERQDPRTSVTFLHPACSGARLDQLWKRESHGTYGLRILNPLLPQLTQIAARLAGARRDREVDAAIAGIGVNDIGFGPVLVYCTGKFEPVPRQGQAPATPCPDRRVRPVFATDGSLSTIKDSKEGRPLRDVIADLLAGLKPKYAQLMSRVRAGLKQNGLGLRSRDRVLFTQYPNFSHGESGVCDTRHWNRRPIWSPETWRWTSETGDRLSEIVQESSIAGYTAVPMEQSTFHGHGYCVEGKDGEGKDKSWFVGAFQATLRLNPHGGFHPNAVAHAAMAAPTQALLCQALYGNPACEGRFRG